MMRHMRGFLLVICFLTPNAGAAEQKVPDLMILLRSRDSEVRYDAARSLARFGEEAKPALDPLIALFRDENPPGHLLQYLGPRVGDAASDTVVRIGRPAVPALVKALDHKNSRTRERAAATLGQLGPLAKDSFEALKTSLDDQERWVRWNVIRAIARIGAAPELVVPLLKFRFRADKDVFNRAEALSALHDADPSGAFAVPILRQQLKASDVVIMTSAVGTLGKYGATAGAAAPALNQLLSTNKQRTAFYADFGYWVPVRADVVRALGQIGPAAELATPSLKRIMDSDRDVATRLWAASALVRIVPNSDNAKAAWRKLLRAADDKNLSETAAEAIGAVGNEAAIAALMEHLQAPDESDWGAFRQAVAKSIGKIGPRAKLAIPALRQALHTKDDAHVGVRCAAAKALGKIGHASKAAIPDLVQWRDAGNRWERDVADEAIRRIKFAPKELEPSSIER